MGEHSEGRKASSLKKLWIPAHRWCGIRNGGDFLRNEFMIRHTRDFRANKDSVIFIVVR
jgi:hypothetical protein